MADLDRELFEKWQSGDQEARNQAWELMWFSLRPFAIGYCRRFTRDASTVESWAADAVNKTFREIDERIARKEISWQGEAQFTSLVHQRLISRCRDEMRKFWKFSGRSLSGDGPAPGYEETDLTFFDLLPDESASPEHSLALAVDDLFRFLAAAAQACRGDKALLETLNCIALYAYECLINNLPPDVNAEGMSIDALVAAFPANDVQIDKAEMYRFIQQALGIERNALYLRIKRIRACLKQLNAAPVQRPEPDLKKSGGKKKT